jgi:PAS domain S-box-containing protein
MYSITKKYLWLFAITLMFPIFLIYQLITNYAENMIETDIINKNVSTTEVAVKQLNNEIANTVLQLQLIAGNREEELVDVDRMYKRAKQAIGESSIIHSVYFLNPNREVVFEAPFYPVMKETVYRYPNFSQIEWSHHYAVSPLLRNYHQEQAVTVAIPVLLKNQQFTGVLIAELSQDYLSEMLRSISVSKGDFSFIIDESGKVIASTEESEIGRIASQTDIAEKLFQESFGVMRELKGGKRSIMAYQALRDGWGLVYGVPESIAFEPLKKLSYVLTLSFIGILVLSLCFIYVGMRNIVYPILRLTDYAKQYDKESSYQPVEEFVNDAKDELGILMKTIVSMGNSNFEKQKMLEEKERYLHDVLEGIPYAIVTIARTGQITYVNKQFELLIGRHRDELMGVHLLDLKIKNDKKDFILMQALYSESPVLDTESYIIDAQGQKRIIKVVASKFFNDKQEMSGILAVMQDISQLKLLESRLKQNDKLALIGQITTGIAHEIKNPLAILSGSSELLKEQVEEEGITGDIKEWSDDIYVVVRRMKEIVNNFLNFAKINKKEAEPIQLCLLLDEVLHLVRIKLNELGVKVIRDYYAKPTIQGRHDQLIQAFLNLVLNAAEAMPAGGVLTITVDEIEDGLERWTVVEVEDTGSGIQEQDLQWLFDPFFSTKENGSGLGLTISRDIIREHRGELEIESKVNEGTTIRCVFHVQ